MHGRILLVMFVFAQSLVIPAVASAETCDSVAPGRKAECHKLARKYCTSSSENIRYNCIRGLVAARFSKCTRPSLVNTCKALSKDTYRLCQGTFVPRANLKEFMNAVQDIPALMTRVNAFRKAAGNCIERPRGAGPYVRRFLSGSRTRIYDCSLEKNDLKRCTGTLKKLRVAWAKHVEDHTSGSTYSIKTKMLTGYYNNPEMLELCSRNAKSLAKDVETLLHLNQKHPSIRVPDGPLKSALAEYRKRDLACKVKLDKVIATRRCPRGKGGSASLARTLRNIAKKWYRTLPGNKFKKKMRKFHLNGRTRRKYNAFTRVTTEYAPSILCVEQRYPDKTDCRILTVTWSRTKARGRGWSRWRADGIGGGAKMLCKNIR